MASAIERYQAYVLGDSAYRDSGLKQPHGTKSTHDGVADPSAADTTTPHTVLPLISNREFKSTLALQQLNSYRRELVDTCSVAWLMAV